MMIQNNEMDEVIEVLVLMVKRAGANFKEYKMIRHVGLMFSAERKEK
jgi:hypothetical protein